jgi:hypothetical protein
MDDLQRVVWEIYRRKLPVNEVEFLLAETLSDLQRLQRPPPRVSASAAMKPRTPRPSCLPCLWLSQNLIHIQKTPANQRLAEAERLEAPTTTRLLAARSPAPMAAVAAVIAPARPKGKNPKRTIAASPSGAPPAAMPHFLDCAVGRGLGLKGGELRRNGRGLDG